MNYVTAKLKAVREEKLFRIYTTDSFLCICRSLGSEGGKRYYDILYPPKEDTRNPQDIANERIKRLGLKVVN